jgi:uncharacterized protein (DUF58 family)
MSQGRAGDARGPKRSILRGLGAAAPPAVPSGSPIPWGLGAPSATPSGSPLGSIGSSPRGLGAHQVTPSGSRIGARRSWLTRLARRFRPPRRLSFTREGRIIVVMAIAVGFAAINTGNNLLYLLLGWILSFIIASGVLSELSMRGLTVERRPPPIVVAGQPFLMEVAIHNDKPKLASFSIEVEDLLLGRPIDKRCYFLKIPPDKTQRTSYRHTIFRRGLHTFEGYRVATRFPFGLFRKSRDVDSAVEVLVVPAPVAVTRPPPRARVHGEVSAAVAGRRGEFFGLREHRFGDDRRNVHWRSTARSGRVMVREYEDEHTRRVTVVVDNALPAPCRVAFEPGELPAADVQRMLDALERTIAVASSLCASYVAAGYVVEVVARGAVVPADSGRRQEARIARALALLPTVDLDTPFAAVIAPQRDSVLVVPAGVAAPDRPPATSVIEA